MLFCFTFALSSSVSPAATPFTSATSASRIPATPAAGSLSAGPSASANTVKAFFSESTFVALYTSPSARRLVGSVRPARAAAMASHTCGGGGGGEGVMACGRSGLGGVECRTGLAGAALGTAGGPPPAAQHFAPR